MNRTRSLVGSIGVAIVGLGVLSIYFVLGSLLVPLPPLLVDGEVLSYFVNASFNYVSSPIDLSVLSGVQGLAGLVHPLAVWLHPGYLPSRFLPTSDPRIWGYIIVPVFIAGATFMLGRAVGLPSLAAVIGGQFVAMFSFPPMLGWSVATTRLNIANYGDPCFALPVALGTLLTALFAYTGRESTRINVYCLIGMPALVVYSVLCTPLYTAVYFIPISVFLAGIYFASNSIKVFLWRSAAGLACIAACLLLQLRAYYSGLFGYAARAVFPNELYVEIQHWDYLANFIFQGGFATFAAVLGIICSSLICLLGKSYQRGFGAAVLCYQLLMVGVSLVYVYSGIRWSLPLPAYLEYGALPAYGVAGLLGLWVGVKKLWSWLPADVSSPVQSFEPPFRTWLTYASILVLPLLGLAQTAQVVGARAAHNESLLPNSKSMSSARIGEIVKHLQDKLALGPDGQFQGSVAFDVGVPGGEIMNRLGVSDNTPFNKGHLDFAGSYLRSFDPHFSMAGLWRLGIPTLEDNSHLVTPPFHFLATRALSRPQDFHSRNWITITHPRPNLMAALGTRFLVADRWEKDSLLDLRAQETNSEGVTLYAFEIRGANLGNFSPTRTILSTSARQTIALMISETFDYKDYVVVHDEPLVGLTRAETGAIYFEKGGVRIQGSSNGRSLLVLPVQFSNSLQITLIKTNSKNVPIKLLRVNLLETGVLFEGEINIKVAEVFGPFRDVSGRLRDIEDCRRLGIEETGEIPYPLDYQPLAKFRPTWY